MKKIRPGVRPGRCATAVLAIFGYLFLMALLFVPCTTTRTKVRPHANPGFMIRTTVPRTSYVFLPQALSLKARGPQGPSVRVKTFQWLASAALVLLLGLFDYFILCRFLRGWGLKRGRPDSRPPEGRGEDPAGSSGFSFLR